MAVTNVELHASGTSGDRDYLNKRKYEAFYLVDVSTVNDQTQTIIEHFQNAGNLPRLGEGPYTYRNDYDPNVICTSISPKRTDKSQTQWLVSCTFETPTGASDDKDNNKDPNGNLTDDPTLWVPRIDVSFMTIQIPIEGAVYQGGFKGGAAALCPIGKVGPIMNSAFVPYVPPPERDFHISVVRRQWYDITFSQDLASILIGRVNSQFYGGLVLGYAFAWFAYQAKIVNYGGSLEFINNRVYWHNNLEVHVNPLGWRRQIADRGLHRRMMAGDPDGRGGTISASDIPRAVAPVGRVVGVDDLPVTEPVLFDGDGQPLVTDAAYPSPVYITYAADPEIVFPPGIMGI